MAVLRMFLGSALGHVLGLEEHFADTIGLGEPIKGGIAQLSTVHHLPGGNQHLDKPNFGRLVVRRELASVSVVQPIRKIIYDTSYVYLRQAFAFTV